MNRKILTFFLIIFATTGAAIWFKYVRVLPLLHSQIKADIVDMISPLDQANIDKLINNAIKKTSVKILKPSEKLVKDWKSINQKLSRLKVLSIT